MINLSVFVNPLRNETSVPRTFIILNKAAHAWSSSVGYMWQGFEQFCEQGLGMVRSLGKPASNYHDHLIVPR